MTPSLFNSSFGKRLSINEVVKEIISFMEVYPHYLYRITIGTDSEGLNNKKTDFVTAIVVHRVGNGGRYFWRRIEITKVPTLRERVIREVMISLEAAKELLSQLKDQITNKKDNFPLWEFEIHVDIGENGKTRSMIQEVVAMIRANNFEAKTKPQSYAASYVADRHV